jgi:hypothetical protein
MTMKLPGEPDKTYNVSGLRIALILISVAVYLLWFDIQKLERDVEQLRKTDQNVVKVVNQNAKRSLENRKLALAVYNAINEAASKENDDGSTRGAGTGEGDTELKGSSGAGAGEGKVPSSPEAGQAAPGLKP